MASGIIVSSKDKAVGGHAEFMTEEELVKDIPQFILDCPITANWVEYRGETYFGMVNYEESIRKGRAVIDLSYCATRALNGLVLRTVDYSKRMIISKIDKQ